MQTPNFRLRSFIHKNTAPAVTQITTKSRKLTVLRELELSPRQSIKNENPKNNILRRLSTTAFNRNSLNPASQGAINIDFSDVIPGWLSAREDFKQNCQNLLETSSTDLSTIVKKPYVYRTSEENELLYNWVNKTEFCKNIPPAIIRDLCCSLSYEYYPREKDVLKQGMDGDRLFIVYEGRVGIFRGNEWKTNVESGGVFGEVALDREIVRQADAKSFTDVKLFVLKDSDYKRIIFSLKNLEKSLNLKLIINIPLFTGLSHNKIHVLLNSCTFSGFNTNEVIYDLEAPASSFYIVQKGLVELQIHVRVEKVNKWPVGTHTWNEREVKKKYAVLFKQCKEGDFFGDFEILKGCNRTMRAVVVEPCQCLVVNSDELKKNFWIRDEKKIIQMRDEYESAILKTEEEFKRNLIEKAESERLLKTVIGNDTKRAIKLKEVLSARKLADELVLKKQLIETCKNERVKEIQSKMNYGFRTFEVRNRLSSNKRLKMKIRLSKSP